MYEYPTRYAEGRRGKKAFSKPCLRVTLCVCTTDKQKREKNGERQAGSFLREDKKREGDSGCRVNRISRHRQLSSRLVLSDVFPAGAPCETRHRRHFNVSDTVRPRSRSSRQRPGKIVESNRQLSWKIKFLAFKIRHLLTHLS